MDKCKGMTVNERLYVSGLMPDFDKAVEKKDIENLKAILLKVDLDEQSVLQILQSYNF